MNKPKRERVQFVTPLLPEIVVTSKIEVKPRLFEVVTDSKGNTNIQKTVAHLYKHIQPRVVMIVSNAQGRCCGYCVLWDSEQDATPADGHNTITHVLNAYPGKLWIVASVGQVKRIKHLDTGGVCDSVMLDAAKNMYLDAQMWIQKNVEPYETTES